MTRPAGWEQLVRLAGEGRRLFPLRPGTKEPYGNFSWPKLATCDLAIIEQWTEDYPNCNWGLATGRQSSEFVIDADPESKSFLKELVREYGEGWTQTRIAKTPRLLHFHFEWSDAFPVRTVSGVRPGIDLRGEGGYVVIPPSVYVNGDGPKPYAWKGKGLNIPLAPDIHHFGFLWSCERHSEPVPIDEKDLIPEGKRNDTLTRLAGGMRVKGFTEDAILAALHVTNRERCSPPLADRELQRIATSVVRYPVEAIPKLATPQAGSDLRGLFLPVSVALTRSTPETEWLIEGYLPASTNIALAAKIKMGKTTLLLDWVRHLVTGESWCGCPVLETGVVYLTEQPAASFNEEVRLAGIDSDRMHVLYRPETLAYSWAQIAEEALKLARQDQCRLIVVDTLTRWAGIAGDGENAASVVSVMTPFDSAPDMGVTMLYVFHSGKVSVEIADAIRGSSALGGAVDQIFRLRRPEGNQEKSYRVLESIGRIQDIPEQAVFNFKNGRYVASGAEDAVALAAVNRELENLPTTPEAAISLDEIARLSESSRRTIRRVISGHPFVRRIGDGTRGNPYLYYTTFISGQDSSSLGSTSMFAQKPPSDVYEQKQEVHDGKKVSGQTMPDKQWNQKQDLKRDQQKHESEFAQKPLGGVSETNRREPRCGPEWESEDEGHVS